MDFTVEYMLNLLKQGKSPEDCLAHARQRFGHRQEDLADLLAEAVEDNIAQLTALDRLLS